MTPCSLCGEQWDVHNVLKVEVNGTLYIICIWCANLVKEHLEDHNKALK